ncbi:hypothetical protein E2C01_077553 [Portunus trituberculatus]
MKREV